MGPPDTVPTCRCQPGQAQPSLIPRLCFPQDQLEKEGGVKFLRLPRCQNPSLINWILLSRFRWPGQL